MTTLNDWTPYQRNAIARLRFCHAYCPMTDPIGAARHNPSCAYNDYRWMQTVLEILRKGEWNV